MTYKALVEKFLKFELENNLFDFKPNSVPLWELLRFKVFDLIKDELCYKNVNIDGRKTFNRLSCFNAFLKNYYFKNPYRHQKKVDFLFFNHPRRKKNGKAYNDIYTDVLLQDFEDDYLVLEGFFDMGHMKPATTKSLYYLDYLQFPVKLVNYLPSKFYLTNGLRENLINLENLVKINFNLKKITVKQHAVRGYKFYKFLKPKIEKLVKYFRPKVVINVVSYNYINQIVTQVAKQKNIPVVELQHGIIGEKNITYSYSIKELPETVPDYFFSWGDYWNQKIKLPIPNSNIVSVGFPYIEKLRKGNKHSKGKKVIFISQMRDDIAQYTYQLAKALPSYKIIFKAHPTEAKVAKEIYSYLGECNNIDIITDGDVSLYNLFKKCTYAIGVNSTALIEAKAFDLDVVILKLPGYEYMEEFLSKNYFHLANNLDKLKETINSRGKKSLINTDKLFAKHAKANMKDKLMELKETGRLT